MPDRVKEKLVELLGVNTCKHDWCEDCEYCEDRDACIAYLKESMADYLIANGVTVQGDKDINVPTKWISVKDRLPEEWVDVLVLSQFGFCEVAVYLGAASGKWRVTWNHNLLEGDITHWMPLPPAPEDVK